MLNQVLVPTGARLSSQGTPVLDGSVSGAGEFVVSSGTLTAQTAVMTGTGTTRVVAGATLRVTNADYYGLLMQGPRQLVNNGTVVAEHTAAGLTSILLNHAGATLTNNATLDLQNGAGIGGTGVVVNAAAGTVSKTVGTAESAVSASFDNNGLVHVSAGTLNFNGQVQSIVGARLDEGTWRAVSPGRIRLPVDITSNAATIILDGVNAAIQDTAADALTNLTTQTPTGSLTIRNGRAQTVAAITQQGTVVVGPGAGSRLSMSSYTQTAGTTTLLTTDATLKTSGATRINGGTLRGLGVVEAAAVGGLTIDLGGRLEPGLDSPGTMSVTGNLVLGNGGKLVVDVDGTGAGQTDRVDVSGNLTVGGEVVIDTGYTPALNNQHPILASVGPRTGKFTAATGADLPGAISWAADYGTNGVTLVAARPTVRLTNMSVVEGDGATDLVFTVIQSRTLLTSTSVTATTSDGTAVDAGPAVGGNDYDALDRHGRRRPGTDEPDLHRACRR